MKKKKICRHLAAALLLVLSHTFINAQIVPRSTLQLWFSNGQRPTQDQFWAWQNSYWHKADTIPQESIRQLASTLNQFDKSEVSVLLFGAKGNGIANDRQPIQAAVDFCAALGGGTVLIPAGKVCVIDSGIYMRSHVSMRIEGTLRHRRETVNEDVDKAFEFTPLFLGNYTPNAYDTTNQQYYRCDSIIGNAAYLININDTLVFKKDSLCILRAQDAWYNGRNSWKPYFQTFAVVDSVRGRVVYFDNDLGSNVLNGGLIGKTGHMKSTASKKADIFKTPFYAVRDVKIYGSGKIISAGGPPISQATAYRVTIDGLYIHALECMSLNMAIKWNVSNLRYRVSKQLLELAICTNRSKFINWAGEIVNDEYKVARQPLIRIGENSYNNLISNISINAYGGGGDSLSVLSIDDGWANTVELLDVIADSLTNGVEIRTGHDSAHVYNNVIQNSRFYLGSGVCKFFIDMNKEEQTASTIKLSGNIFRNLEFYGSPKNAAVRFDGDDNTVSGSYFATGDVSKTSTVMTAGTFINNRVINPGQRLKGVQFGGNYNSSILYPLIVQDSFNNGVGSRAFINLNGGASNVAFGDSALSSITNSNNNTAIGSKALALSVASSNSAIGSRALYSNTTGYFNVAIGPEALFSNTITNKNVAIGRRALFNSSGTGNLAIGNTAAENLTTGSNNIFIGTDITSDSPSISNSLNIGNLIYALDCNTSGSGVSNGRVGINKRIPAYTLDVNGSGRYAGSLTIGSNTFPASLGSNGQILQADGTGSLNWITPNSSGGALFAEVSGGNFTTNSTSATNITGLSVPLLANKTYRVVVVLSTGSTGSSGINVGFSGPSGSSVLSGHITGVNSSASTVRVNKVSAMGTLNSNPLHLYNGTNGSVTITAYVRTGETAGNLTAMCASVNAGETTTIYEGSAMDAIVVF
jgi:hypothetical protein